MLSFDIRSLESRAESVDGLLETADSVWESTDVRPHGAGVRVVGRLSGAGPGRFYFSGQLEGTAVTTCRRCLTAGTSAVVVDDVQLVFATSGLEEADEADVIQIPAGVRELDLRPAVREEWLLAVPGFALCREDCKGLCPTCGADRNTGECSCAPATDPRWAALRDLRGSDA